MSTLGGLPGGPPGPGEVVLELLGGLVVLGPNDAVLHDRRQVAVRQAHVVEAPLVVREVARELGSDGALRLGPEEVGEVALTGDEADDRDGAGGVLRLLELHELLHLLTDEGQIARAAGEPEDQLVEVEDDRVVAEPLGVAAHHAEAGVEVHEARALRRPRGEESADEVAEQPGPRALGVAVLVAQVGAAGRRVEGLDVPRRRGRALAPARYAACLAPPLSSAKNASSPMRVRSRLASSNSPSSTYTAGTAASGWVSAAQRT
jgi:hypothetical protein